MLRTCRHLLASGLFLGACMPGVCGQDAPATPAAVKAPPAAATPAPAVLPAPTDEAEQQFAFAAGLSARKLYRESTEEFRRFLTGWPNHPKAPDAQLYLGEAHFSAGEYEAARRAFGSFVAAFPKHPKTEATRVRIGCCLFQEKKFAEAAALLKSLPTLPEPHESTRQYYLGRSLQETGNLAEAEKALGAARKNPESGVLAQFSLGEIALARKDYTKAVNEFTEFLKDAPRHRLAPAAAIRQAEALREKKEWARALAVCRSLPQFATDQEKRLARYSEAWCLLSMDNVPEAQKAAQDIIAAEDPELTDGAAYLLGVTLLRQRKYPEAAQAFLAVKAGLHVPEARLERVRSLVLSNNHDAAIAEASSLAAAMPAFRAGSVQFLLGVAQFRKGVYPAAVAALEGAIADKDNPDRADAAWYLALAREKDNQPKKAAEAWAFFVDGFPGHPRRLEAMQCLAQARSRALDHAGAIAAAQSILADKAATPEARLFALRQVAASAYEMKNLALMEKSYRELLTAPGVAAPQAREARYWLAWLAQSQGKYIDAANAFGQLVAENVQDDFSARARYRQGMCYYQAGSHKEAATIFLTILTDYPTIEIGYEELLWLGGWFVRNHEAEKADRVYESLLKLTNNPSVVAMALYRQAEMRRENRQWDAAAEKYRQLIGRQDANFTALSYYGLGVSLFEAGQVDAAAQAYAQAKLDPADPMTGALAFELGRVAEAQNRPELALRHYMRVGVLYDDAELTGKALFHAAMLYRRTGEAAKAMQCLSELLDTGETGFARRHPQSPWIEKAKAALVQPAAPVSSAAGAPGATLAPR